MHTTRNSFAVAWQLFKLHWRSLLGAEAVLLGFGIVLELSVVGVSHLAHSWNVDAAGVVINVVLHAAFLLVFSGVLASTHRLASSLVDGDASASLGIADAFSIGPSYLLANLVYVFATLVGLAALLLPGIYVAARLAFFRHSLLANRCSALQALRNSALMTKADGVRLAIPTAAALALNLAGAAAGGIGFFISWPVTVLACAQRFHVLRARAAAGLS